MGTVPLAQTIANVRMLLQISSNEKDSYFLKLASDGARRLKSYDTLVANEATIPIVNFSAELPCGIFIMHGVRLPGTLDPVNNIQAGNYIYPAYSHLAFPCTKNMPNQNVAGGISRDVMVDNAVIGDLPPNNTPGQFVGGYWFSIQNDCMLFSTNITQQVVEIAYYGWALDADGFPIITENSELAIQYFIMWQFAFGRPDKYSMAIIKEYENQWILAARKSRAKPNIYDRQDYTAGTIYNTNNTKTFGWSWTYPW